MAIGDPVDSRTAPPPKLSGPSRLSAHNEQRHSRPSIERSYCYRSDRMKITAMHESGFGPQGEEARKATQVRCHGYT